MKDAYRAYRNMLESAHIADYWKVRFEEANFAIEAYYVIAAEN